MNMSMPDVTVRKKLFLAGEFVFHAICENTKTGITGKILAILAGHPCARANVILAHGVRLVLVASLKLCSFLSVLSEMHALVQ